MKKFFIAVSLIFAAITVNAQWYVGGSLNFSTETDKNSDGDKMDTDTRFNISESLGYYVTDKFDIGMRAGFGLGSLKNHTADTKSKSASWTLAPYARYSFLQFNKFEVIARAELSYRGNRTKNDDGDVMSENTAIGINIAPILAYNLTDHLVLTTTLNFASFGFNSFKVKDGNTLNEFGFGFDSDNVMNIGGTNGVTIGFLYKF